jgi:hypothetical protein
LIRIAIGTALPITDPTEGRYALISREMATSGDWVTPTLWMDGRQAPYLGKPPFYFWMSTLSIRLLGPTEFAVRLPAIIATALILALMFLLLKRSLGAPAAATGVVITATTGLVFLLVDSVTVDLHLMFFVAGAVRGLLDQGTGGARSRRPAGGDLDRGAPEVGGASRPQLDRGCRAVLCRRPDPFLVIQVDSPRPCRDRPRSRRQSRRNGDRLCRTSPALGVLLRPRSDRSAHPGNNARFNRSGP